VPSKQLKPYVCPLTVRLDDEGDSLCSQLCNLDRANVRPFAESVIDSAFAHSAAEILHIRIIEVEYCDAVGREGLNQLILGSGDSRQPIREKLHVNGSDV
jgi:hypothetical protein